MLWQPIGTECIGDEQHGDVMELVIVLHHRKYTFASTPQEVATDGNHIRLSGANALPTLDAVRGDFDDVANRFEFVLQLFCVGAIAMRYNNPHSLFLFS